LIVIENTKQKDLEAISDVQKIESEDKKEESTEVSKKEEQSKKNVKNELDEKQTTVSQEENIHVSEETTEIVPEIEEVTEPEGYGSIIIPDGDEAFQSAEEVIFGEIPDRFSKDEIVEDNQENK
jgi:hypothetical protein